MYEIVKNEKNEQIFAAVTIVIAQKRAVEAFFL